MVAQAVRPGKTLKLRWSAVGAALIEDVPGIVLHAMFFEKRDVFILERHVAMVRFLIQNIPFDCGQIGDAYGKCPVTFLPVEVTSLIVHPAGRV